MGADQIGYLVKGPARILTRGIPRAVRACLARRRELLDEAGPDADEWVRRETALEITNEFFDPVDIPDDPEPVVKEFVDWWRSLNARDTTFRVDPDDPRQRIVYAGDMSYGDEPDGRGYQMLKRAFAWGFAEALGVR